MRYAHMYYYYYYCYAYITILYQPIIQKKVVQGYRKKNRGLTLKYLMVGDSYFSRKNIWTIHTQIPIRFQECEGNINISKLH